MKLAVLHYHLNRGGVTRVIANHLAALDAVHPSGEPLRVALLYGGRREGWPGDLASRLGRVEVSLHAIDGLDYDGPDSAIVRPAPLADRVQATLDEIGFAPDETVLHVHNHSLGKNLSLPGALRLLAARGYALLLEIHDFAEDLRPANYRRLQSAETTAGSLAGDLYPQAPHIHYAVLNRRDRDVLAAAGVPADRLHDLPNPVLPFGDLPLRARARAKLEERFGIAPHRRLLLYPVRCIRRKNVGEALLWAAMQEDDSVVGITLKPLNPAERPRYEDWRRFQNELDLPVRFELGEPGGLTFEENLSAADVILTTSVAEGFGMVFLESWLVGRPLLGRDLPEITADFVEAGVELPWVRPRLAVPADWVQPDFQQMIAAAYRQVLEACRHPPPPPEELSRGLQAKLADGAIDFGDLDESLQRQVISRVRRSHSERRRLAELNPWMHAALHVSADEALRLSRRNRAAIDRELSAEPGGRRLLRILTAVRESPRGDEPLSLPQPERILQSFLAFARFRALRA